MKSVDHVTWLFALEEDEELGEADTYMKYDIWFTIWC